MNSFSSLLRHNWKPGLSVALINIPLSLSLAVASLGMGSENAPLLGILTAIWGGAFAAFFASNKQNIYGPAGALSGILLAFVLQSPENVYYIPLLALFTGLISIGISFLKLTKYITLIPSSALHGFLMGVGITIALSQLNSALGITPTEQQSSILQNLFQTFSQISETNWLSFLLFSFGLSFLLIFKRFVPSIPGAIPLTIIGIGLGMGFSFLHTHGLWNASLPTVQSIGDKFPSLSFSLIHFQDITLLKNAFTGSTFLLIVKYSLVITIIAILESIIAAKIAEKMTKDSFDKDKEVFGLGMANIASGLVGGLPATAVLVRTALNAKNGASSRISAFLAALFTLCIAWFFFDAFTYLPMPIIAAILMNIAIGMIDFNFYQNIHSLDKVSFYITLFVAFLTVVDDPIVGIIFGTTLSLLFFIGKVSKGNTDITVFRNNIFYDKLPLSRYIHIQEPKDIILYRFAAAVNYINTEGQLEYVKKLKNISTIVFSLGQVNNIDIDGIETFEEIFKYCKEQGTEIYITGMSHRKVEKVIRNIPLFQEIEAKGNVYKSSAFVLQKLHITAG